MLPEAAAACIYFAAQTADLPPAILMTVLRVEAGREGSHSPNGNGTEDFGPGQINTIWLNDIAKAAGRPVEETKTLLQWDGCFNIRMTAAILRLQINQAHDFWTGVGWYHSRLKAESLAYIQKVVTTARRLFGPDIIPTAKVETAITTEAPTQTGQNLPATPAEPTKKDDK
jgi:hypothetical protein